LEFGKGYWILKDIENSAELRVEAIGSYCVDSHAKSRKGIRENL
jgi:hypothetical protein